VTPHARIFVIYGRVQGVGFRWWTRSLALGLGIRGSVRNRPDGSVELRAAGDQDAMAKFRAALNEGPPGSTVERIDEEAATLSLPESFEIAG
jgi:acylphosphatase